MCIIKDAIKHQTLVSFNSIECYLIQLYIFISEVLSSYLLNGTMDWLQNYFKKPLQIVFKKLSLLLL